MMEISIYPVLFTFLLLFVLLYFWNNLYKDFILDLFKQDICDLRDEIFDLAASRQYAIGFEDELYNLMLSTFNGTIKIGENLRLTEIFIFNFLNAITFPNTTITSREQNKFQALTKAIKDQKTKAKITEINMKYEKVVTKYLTFSSLSAIILLIFSSLRFIIKSIFKGKKHLMSEVKTETEQRFKARINYVRKQAELLAA